MARMRETNRSSQTLSSIIELDRNSTSRSTAGFPNSCLSLSLSINYSYNDHSSSRHSLPTHPCNQNLSFRVRQPAPERESCSNHSSSSFTYCQVHEYPDDSSESEQQFVWAEEQEEQEEEEDQSSHSQEQFNANDFSFNMSAQQSGNVDSPFFQEPSDHRGLTHQEINRLPEMAWGAMHNKFNKGEKCSVCLEEYKIGSRLRVMACLHRFHVSCLDEWLESRANCPNCRMIVQK